MKTTTNIFSVLLVAFTLIFGINAAFAETLPSQTANAYEQLVDQYIARCQAKTEFKNSSMDNIRQDAAVAVVKGAFAKTYRAELIDVMIQDGVSPKSYKVQVYLNEKFNNFVTDELYASIAKKKSTL